VGADAVARPVPDGAAAGAADDPEYLGEHLREALATDPRVQQPGLEVRVTRALVVVRGCVPTEAVRSAVADVVGDRATGWEIVNEVEVTPNVEPAGAEDLP
jgi:hypothetical protein